MARLASDAKIGFYPTSTKTIKKVIDKAIEFPENRTVVALDCCCGNGEAIEFIGKEYGCITYGIELEEKRAKIASQRSIKVVLNGDSLNGIRKSNTWAGLNFMNPPYGTNVSGGRLEIDFVKRWGLTTAIGGVLILVINKSSADEEMIKELRMQDYRPVFSFYDEDNLDYQKYGQFFIVLQRQSSGFRSETERFMSLFSNPMNVLDDIKIDKINIKTGGFPEMFKEIEVPRWKIDEYLSKSKLKKSFFDDLKKASINLSSIEHPNDGQSAILISSGALNKKLILDCGTEIILKGTTTKEKLASEELDSDGIVSSVKLVDHYKTVVYGLNLSQGHFVKYS